MRNFFLLLVLVNLGFVAWQLWYVDEPLQTRQAAQPSNSLVLLREIGADDEGSARNEPAPAEEPAVAQSADQPGSQVAGNAGQCRSAGPFMSEAAAESASDTLADAGLDARIRPAEGQVWIGQWVYIESIETQAEAREIAQIFQDAGVTEAYVIGNDTGSNIVSLGVFQQRTRALQRRDEANELDFEPVVADQTRAGTVYRLDVDIASADDDWLSLIEADSPVQIGLTDCETP